MFSLVNKPASDDAQHAALVDKWFKDQEDQKRKKGQERKAELGLSSFLDPSHYL